MSGPAWLAGVFAALMIVIAAYCACRLAKSRLRGGNAERDSDGLHLLMGLAMAGMFEPRLASVPGAAWAFVFSAAGAWFAWRAARAGRAGAAHPAAHAVECGAMVYMLLPVGSWPPGGHAMPMAGMNQGATAANPVLTLVLALLMLGNVVWAADRLASSRAARPRVVPAPGRSFCYKIAMGITMVYMLVAML